MNDSKNAARKITGTCIHKWNDQQAHNMPFLSDNLIISGCRCLSSCDKDISNRFDQVTKNIVIIEERHLYDHWSLWLTFKRWQSQGWRGRKRLGEARGTRQDSCEKRQKDRERESYDQLTLDACNIQGSWGLLERRSTRWRETEWINDFSKYHMRCGTVIHNHLHEAPRLTLAIHQVK